jgi:hypothetical protein
VNLSGELSWLPQGNMTKRGFLNQKLGKRNSRRAILLKAKAGSRPSWHKSQASKPLDVKGHQRAP